ncbi:hypothetical protein CEXT_143351 [Caerostris extrusa]|uniref:Uncharacterized protein n=1 Tax=Caerostris extrusa TaxID=172846 RepID=A0AAV4P8Y9_CAEEX|nr:hypothetical protein CEXT_143351 [Caerostris extrusa]
MTSVLECTCRATCGEDAKLTLELYRDETQLTPSSSRYESQAVKFIRHVIRAPFIALGTLSKQSAFYVTALQFAADS